jgi:hypothetical protein
MWDGLKKEKKTKKLIPRAPSPAHGEETLPRVPGTRHLGKAHRPNINWTNRPLYFGGTI